MTLNRKWTAAVLAGAALAVAAAYGHTPRAEAQSTDAAGLTLAVDGSGSVLVAPDEAQVDLGVTTRDSDAESALADDSAKMQSVVTALRQAGVADRDLRTTGLAVSPVYDGNPPRVDGFQATNTVDVTVHDLSRVGVLVDAGLHAGADQVSGIRFTVRDPAALRRQAYQSAMDDARASAQALAAAAGLHLVGVRSVSESGGCCAQPLFDRASVAAPATPPPVFGGRQSVQVNLRVVFDVTR